MGDAADGALAYLRAQHEDGESLLLRALLREGLLDEVEQRLRKPHRRVIAAQTLRHVRHLLTLPAASRPPVG